MTMTAPRTRTGADPASPAPAPAKTALMIAGEFPPVKTIGRLRTVKFVEHLRAHGWRAVVLTIEPNDTSARADPALEREIPADTPVYRAPNPDLEAALARRIKRLTGGGGTGGAPAADAGRAASPAGPAAAASARPSPGGVLKDRLWGLVKRGLRDVVHYPDGYRPWVGPAERVGRRILAEHPIDLIFTTLPPFSAALIGDRLARASGLPWVVDYRDLWTGDVLREWVGPVRGRLETRLERRLMRRADAVVTVSEPKTAFVRELVSPCRARFATVTNGYDPEEFADIAPAPRPDDDTIRFVFTGRLFKNRRGYAFAEALGRLKREAPDLAARARVTFLGGVAPEIAERYRQILEAHGLAGQVHFPGDVPHREAKQAQVDADYLLLIVDTGATSDGVIPGKLFEYVAARRPIFALTDPGATADIIREGRLGRVVAVEDVEGCTAALRDVLGAPVPPPLSMDDPYLAQFDRRALAARLAEVFDAVLADRRGAG
jgi:glycosyltransferase involved in cell wall biosynthesis